MLIKQKFDEKVEEELDKLKDGYLEVMQIISEHRKKGKDTAIADAFLTDIPGKIKMAEKTKDKRDIEIAKKSIENIKKESAELDNGSDFEQITQLIQDAFEDLRQDRKSKAAEKYVDIMRLYKLLTKTMKQTVYSACAQLRKRLQCEESKR